MANLNDARYSAAAAIINSHVMIAGGIANETKLSSVERYSFTENMWNDMPPMKFQRANFALVGQMNPRECLIAIGDVHEIEKFDPWIHEWIQVRERYSAFLICNLNTNFFRINLLIGIRISRKRFCS